MTKRGGKINAEKWIRIAARSWFVLFSLSFLLILAWLFLTKFTHANDEMMTEWLVRWNVISLLMFIGASGAKFIFDLRKNEGSNEEEIKDKMKRRKPNGGIWANDGCRCGTSHGTPSGSNHGRRRLGGQIIQQEDIVKNTFNSFLEGASVTCFVGYLFAIMVFIVSACISWALNINIASFLAGTGLVIVGTILGYGICLLMYANYNKYYKKK